MSYLDQVQTFFSLPAAERAVKPLSDKCRLKLVIEGQEFTLAKKDGRLVGTEGAPAKPDMTFTLTPGAAARLSQFQSDDIGEIGIEIVKIMASADPAEKITARVHIGPIDLMFKGYLGILPLGGPAFMKFLASKGFGSVGKVKDAITKLRE